MSADTPFKAVRRAVRYLQTQANGKDTTVGAVADRTGLSCEEVVRIIEDEFYWICLTRMDGDISMRDWPVFEDGD